VHQLDFFWKNLIDAVFDDGMGLAAANFHDHPGLGHRVLDCGQDCFCQRRISVLIKIFHGAGQLFSKAIFLSSWTVCNWSLY
jgi:hypothetical protein